MTKILDGSLNNNPLQFINFSKQRRLADGKGVPQPKFQFFFFTLNRLHLKSFYHAT